MTAEPGLGSHPPGSHLGYGIYKQHNVVRSLNLSVLTFFISKMGLIIMPTLWGRYEAS